MPMKMSIVMSLLMVLMTITTDTDHDGQDGDVFLAGRDCSKQVRVLMNASDQHVVIAVCYCYVRMAVSTLRT